MAFLRRIRLPAALALAAAALLAVAPAASPAAGRSSFTVALTPVLPPAILGTLYPPKPYSTVSFCRPALKFGKQCGGYTFKVSAKGGSMPAGMSVDAPSGAVIGLPRGRADTFQQAGSTPGVYRFAICAVSKKGAVCKPTQLAVFSALGGTWKGSFQGDPGAFTCNTPLAGDITLALTQKVTIVKGAAKSTVGGSVTMTNLPPISTDGQQNGPCTTDTQTFGLGPGNVVNPGAGGVNSANGVWNLTVAGDGTLSGSLTVQDKGKSGFFSEFTFTATR